MSDSPITEADLNAYVDGLLPPSQLVEIEAYLSESPAEMARMRAYREQNAALRALYDPILNEPVPQRLIDVVRNKVARWQWHHLAAGIVISIISGLAGWFLHGPRQSDATIALSSGSASVHLAQVTNLAHHAAIAHAVYSPDVRRPVEIGSEQEEQLVTWLSKRIGSKIRPPKLGKAGYELIGGRLLPGESGPVAQFMYQDAAGQRLTLYVSTEQQKNRDTGFRFAHEGPVNVFYWIDGKFGYALSASIGKQPLSNIASLVYEGLEKTE